MGKKNYNLIWFRSDLRFLDNPALFHAQNKNDPVIGLIILTPEQWTKHDWGNQKVSFYIENIKVLEKNLNRLNIPLLIRQVDNFKNIEKIFSKLIKTHPIKSLYYNLDYEVNEQRRDKSVQKLMHQNQIPVHTYHDQLIFDISSLKNQQDKPYTVFTPFKKTWLKWFEEQNIELTPSIKPQEKLKITSDTLPPEIEGYKLLSNNESYFEPGEKKAHQKLKSFLENHVEDYNHSRDFPSQSGTSQISPYLTHGVLSTKQCYLAALKRKDDFNPDQKINLKKWMDEIIWREFYRYILIHFPKVCKNQNFQEKTNQIKWNQNKNHFQKWCQGKTGVPIVDAGMRQLNQIGWMHNRVRMIVAMFLTKNLFIDWRWGEKYFMNQLIDGDFASNNGGWQWSSSTGTDAAPYFRIFNPESQAKRFDPEAKYIKKYIPELKDCEPSIIHNHTKLTPLLRKSIGYPDMICDLKESRSKAISKFKNLI